MGIPSLVCFLISGVAIGNTPFRIIDLNWIQNKYSYSNLVQIAQNFGDWTFVSPWKNLFFHSAPVVNIDLRNIPYPLRAVSDLRLVPYPQGQLTCEV